MSRRNITTICITFLILLGIPSWTDGQESNNPWLYSLLDAVKSSEQGKGFYRPAEYGRDNDTLLRIIHNINKHIEEVERLRIQGFHESEIQTYFMTYPAGLAVGSISGRVRLKGEEPPYHPSIYVSVYSEYGYFAGSDYILSSDEGNYRITGLLPGKYYLRASAYGYTTKYYRNTNDWKKAKLVRVKKGKNTGRKNFVLESTRGKGALSGQVKGKDGTPLSDCYIYAYSQGYGYNSGGSANTDENGKYTIEGLKDGKYKLHCEYTGQRSFVSEWYKDEQSYESATSVTVTEPKMTTGINFVLEYGGTIKGKVFCASGKKADAYLCSLYAYDESKYLVKSGNTDENGKFSIPGLGKGNYRLYASYHGPENSLNGWYRKAEDFEQATPIHINPPEIKTIKIKLKPGGAISGKVVDFNGEPVFQNCSIEVYDENKQYAGYTWPDENGSYKVMRLRSGRYKLFAEYDAYYPSFSPEPKDEWYDGCQEYDEAAFVHVKASKTTPNIDFSLEQGGSIGGTVYRKEGYPAYPDGWVSAYDLEGYFVGSSQVVSDGQYFIGGLPSGEYKLRASHNDYQSEWYDRKQNFEMAETVKVTVPSSTRGIDFTLEYPSIIQGFLTDKKGHHLVEDDYLISVYAYDAYTGEYISNGSNSFTGGFRLRLLDGNYKLAAVSMYSNWQQEQDNLAATFYLNGKNFYDPNSQSINLVQESIRNLKDMAMNRAGGSITGTLYDGSTLQPVVDTGYMLLAFDEYGYLAKVSAYLSDDQPITGEYKLMGLRPGNYYVLAVLITEDIFFLWYPDVASDITDTTFTPKIEIPAGAYIVIVGNSETAGIDFYLKGSTGLNN